VCITDLRDSMKVGDMYAEGVHTFTFSLAHKNLRARQSLFSKSMQKAYADHYVVSKPAVSSAITQSNPIACQNELPIELLKCRYRY